VARTVRLLAVAAALAGTACRPEPAPQLVHDLARDAPAALLEAPWQIVRFGSPDAVPHQLDGFVPAPSTAEGEPRAWARPRVRVGFDAPAPVERMALLDVGPHPQLAHQAAEAFLNDVPIGRLEVGAARRRHLLTLPAAAQRPGTNVLELRFAARTERIRALRTRLAAALYGVALVGPPYAGQAQRLAGAPPLLAGRDGELTQAGPSALRFVVRAPANAQLRFAPTVPEGVPGEPVRFSVTLAEGAAPEREVWSRTLREPARGPGEQTLRLEVTPGSIIAIGLHVAGAGEGPVWGRWLRPRLLGTAGGDPFAAGPHAPEHEARAAGLRAALSGVNVIYLILDAAGARHFGCYGYGRRTTPEIDRLAAEGVVFENAFTVAGYTLFAMGSAFTSLYPEEHLGGQPGKTRLPAALTTVAEVLSENGVRTGGFVANDLAGEPFGLHQGFESFVAVHRRFKGGARAFRKVLPQWLAEAKERRSFGYVHFREPHFAYDPPPPFDTLFGPDAPLPRARRRDYAWLTAVNEGRVALSSEEREHLVRLYDGSLASVDAEVGALRRALEAEGLWDRTVVIVSSDHGEALYEHGYVGHLDSVAEEVLRIPLIVRFPRGSAPAGLRVAEPVDIIDVAPTLADLFGLSRARGTEAFRGRSLLPMLFGAPGRAARVARNGSHTGYALRLGPLKLVEDLRRGTTRLYDLAEDPGEQLDQAARSPLVTAFYRQALRRFLLELRRAAPPDAEAALLTDEQKEALRALGYVQ
jgi:arylsulfatase A-like enzyme